MQWIYLSPHLDDVALSCGGLLWEQAQNGDLPLVWTVCAGDPPPEPLSPFAEELHQRWRVERDAVQVRRSEDVISCARLGAGYHHFDLPDCIYRRSPQHGQALYTTEEAIFGSLHPDESGLVGEMAALLAQKLHDIANPELFKLVSPLAIGGHVDHRLTRAVAERLGQPLWYYADYPYVAGNAESIPSHIPQGWEMRVYPVSQSGLKAWVDSIAAHRTQISTFWADEQIMRSDILAYARESGGVRLWSPPWQAGAN